MSLMALYTHLNKKHLVRFAQSFDLSQIKNVQGILAGTVNTYYRFQAMHPLLQSKNYYYLKIDEVGSKSRLEKELKILKKLGQAKHHLGFETPSPLKTHHGCFYFSYQKKFVLIFKEISGKSFSAKQLKALHLKQIGSALGRLHRFTPHRGIPLHRFHQGELQKVYAQIQKKLKKKHPTIDLEICQWMGWLKKKSPSSIPHGVIHADLFPENILFQGSKLSGILDFEAAGHGPYLFDVAVAIHACCTRQHSFDITKACHLIQGYQAIRVLTKQEKKYFEYFLYESALRFLLTRLRDFELKDGPVKASPFKDYRDYLQRFAEIPGFMKKLNL